MFALRNKETKEYIKINYHGEGLSKDFYLVFADHCIEINYYVSCTLGFISSVLKQDEEPSENTPYFDASVVTEDLEVVNLKTNQVVPINEVFDGYDDDEIPVNRNYIENEFDIIDDIETIELVRN